ncbi:hypothetical protein ACFYW8_42320 [Streptomyces sp. NPDC002742]|uniref:hypothetical protein n=1 Tax=Streptomyces sp. NPDC002742 TaxID=3364663 RepID=UPI0036B39872
MERPATFVALSSAPELLTATWVLTRESLIAGAGDRTGKELAAPGVSLANRCPFRVDAHTMLLYATGDHSPVEAIALGETPSDERQARVPGETDARSTGVDAVSVPRRARPGAPRHHAHLPPCFRAGCLRPSGPG